MEKGIGMHNCDRLPAKEAPNKNISTPHQLKKFLIVNYCGLKHHSV